MIRRLFLLGSLIAMLSAHAQRGRDLGWVQGTVIDATTQEPVLYARIIFSSPTSSDTACTDFDGLYLIRTPKRKLTVRLDQKGYATYVGEVDPKDVIIFQDIALVPVK